MTGGMLGLAGSTGVAGAASNGGSRKISSNQMPSHNHAAQNSENSSNTYYFNVSLSPSTDAIGIASVQRGNSEATYFAILDNRAASDSIGDGTQDLGFATTTKNTGGGGRRLYSCTHLCLRLEENRLRELVIANGIH